jgi:ABC-type multidrug transport system ATPase subunit
MDPIITGYELTKRYRDGTTAPDVLDLTIPHGVIYGLLGPCPQTARGRPP